MGVWLTVFGLLCGFGTAVFAADSSRRPANVILAVAAFAATLAWTGFERLPPPGAVGVLVALTAGIRVFRPNWPSPSGVISGVLAGVLSAFLFSRGLPLAVAMILAAGVPVVAGALTRRRASFAPDALVEEATMLVGALALVVAAGPTVDDGLRTAAAINLPYAPRAVALAPVFVATAALAAAAGGVYTLWWRSR